MPDENDPTIPDEWENQLAEQHPTNGGNLSRPDEWELSTDGAASYQWWQSLKT
ncbi:MAG: hypothetical protein HXX20_22645 [Chloroflexi bacterium]|nr:hypothetical protein [Chloroflexota bacterium]